MPDENLKESLAHFISERREKLGLSQSGLAKKCNMSLSEIEDIESGVELFVPTTIRQKLAKGLKINLNELRKYEISEKFELVSQDIIDDLKEDILNGQKNLKCPLCGETLITRIVELYDLEDNLNYHPKGRCPKCPFQIK